VKVSPGSTLKLTNCCFIDNSIIGNGLILIDREEDLKEAGNNFVSSGSSDKSCNFIAFTGNGTGPVCIEADSDNCQEDVTDDPPTTSSCSHFTSFLTIALAFTL